jgi:hypothetical protein
MPPKAKDNNEPKPKPDADAAVTMADAAALNATTAAGKAKEPAFAETVKAARAAEVPFISEAMRQEIEEKGWAVDQGTGRKVTREDMESALSR